MAYNNLHQMVTNPRSNQNPGLHNNMIHHNQPPGLSSSSSGGGGMIHPPSSDNPITFTTPQNSYLVIPRYANVSSHSTSVTLKLRTTEPNGLVLYSSNGVTNPSTNNLVAIELVEGHVIVHLHGGSPTSPPTRIVATTSRVHDGEWHTIKLIRTGRTGSVSVDDGTTDFNLKSDQARNINLGTLFLGNVPGFVADERVWSVSLGVGFVGCIAVT